MFRWVDLLRLWPKSAPDDSRGESQSVRLLTITVNDGFYATLVDISSSCKWEIRRASTIPEGLAVARSFAMPLIVLDWDEKGDDLRDGVNRLSAAPNHPCVLVATRFADDNLRQEVMRFRGYDILARSADREQIIRTIEFAWFWSTRSQRFADGVKHVEARR